MTRMSVIACLAVLAAAAVVPQAGSRTAATCATSGLVVWLDTSGSDSAAGSTYVTLQLTNLSRHSCALRGYPGLSAVDLAGRQVGAAASRNPAVPVRTIHVAPGERASVLVQINQVGVFPAGACKPVTAAGFRVYPPGSTSSRIVPFPFRACTGSAAYLHVRAVKAS
jgi:hypothetical protein